MKDLTKLIEDRPGFWLFLCVVVVVGGPTFLNQMVERYLPGGAQLQVSQDVEKIETIPNQLRTVLRNQKRMLEDIAHIKRSVDDALDDRVDLDVRMTRLEAWRRYFSNNLFNDTPTGLHPNQIE